MYGASFTSRVRAQLHRFLTSPQSVIVQQQVLSKNFTFIENGVIQSSPSDPNLFVEAINTLDTPRGIEFTALLSSNDSDIFWRYDITINIDEDPLNMLPLLGQINAYYTDLDNNSLLELPEHESVYKENRALRYCYHTQCL